MLNESLDAGEADLRRGDLAAIQDADFMPSPVVLPTQGVGCAGSVEGEKRCSVNSVESVVKKPF